MRVRFIALILVACGAFLFAVPQPPAPAEPQRAEAIDFDVLHAQANAALEALQQPHERRVASAVSTEF